METLAIKSLTGGSGGGQVSKFVGTVDSTTTAFPTSKIDPTTHSPVPLENEDFVRATGASSTFPFTLEGVEFENPGQKAYYSTATNRWAPDVGSIIETNEVIVKDKTVESISGTAENQKAINTENRTEINLLGKTFTLTETDTDSVRSFILNIKDRLGNDLLNKTLSDFILKSRKIAGINLEDDITTQELEDALKEISATYKNKTISADDNTIQDLDYTNFKEHTDNIGAHLYVSHDGTVNWTQLYDVNIGTVGGVLGDYNVREVPDKVWHHTFNSPGQAVYTYPESLPYLKSILVNGFETISLWTESTSGGFTTYTSEEFPIGDYNFVFIGEK